MKKGLCIILVVMMVMGLVQTTFVYSAELPDEVTDFDSIKWTIDENGVLIIKSEITTMPSFVDVWDHYSPWYSNDEIKKIVFPDSVTHIGKLMFGNCVNLAEVVLPRNLKQLHEDAFEGCTNLKKIHISAENEYYKTIDGVLFDKTGEVLLIYPVAKKDVEYTIPQGVTTIKTNAFKGCEFIQKIVLASTLKTIERYAFMKCTNLNNLFIPENVTYIGVSAFKGCEKLADITIEGCVYMQQNPFMETAFYNNSGNWEGNSIYVSKHLLKVNSDATDGFVIKPDTVSIAGGAFKSNRNIKKVTIPGSVKCIGEYVVASSNIVEIVIEEGLEIVGDNAFVFSAVENINLPYTVKTIGERAFQDCKIKEFYIPDSVTDIGEGAFESCTNLESITIGRGIENIENNTFYGCNKLSSVSIPDNVKKIGLAAFGNCENLATLHIGSGVETLNGDIIRKCVALVNIYVSQNNPQMSSVDGVVFDKSGEKLLCYPAGRSVDTYTIPDGVKVIGEKSINTSNLMRINLPKSVEKIEKGAFLYCSNFKSIYFEGTRGEFEKIEVGDNNEGFNNAITEFSDGYKNVYGNLRLEEKEDKVYVSGLVDKSAVSVEIPGEINGKNVEIKAYAFENTQLKKVVLDEKIKNIPAGAFSNCAELEEINLDNIETIGAQAFSGCTSLVKINLLNIKSWSGVREDSIDENGTNMYFSYDRYLFRYDIYSIMTVFYQAKIDTLCIKWPETNFDEKAKTLPALFINADIDKVIFENFTVSPSVAEFKKTGSISANPRWQSSVTLEMKNTDMVIYGSDENTRLYAERIGVEYKDVELYNDSFNYDITDNAVVITKYIGNEKELVIPDVIEGYPVTIIGTRAFRDKSFEKVVVGKNVKVIEAEAFHNCDIDKVVVLSSDTLIKRAGSEAINAGGIEKIYYLEKAFYSSVGTIYAPLGSDAEAYAESFGIDFISLENEKINEKVKLLSELGIFRGYEDGDFKLHETLSRAEAAAVIVRAMNKEAEAVNGETKFHDVSQDHWASGYINVVNEIGIVNGFGDGTFKPEEKVTYHQFIKMLCCILGYDIIAERRGGWVGGGYIEVADMIRITKDIEFDKDDFVTREDVVNMIYNSLEIEFIDEDSATVGLYGDIETDNAPRKNILTEFFEYGLDKRYFVYQIENDFVRIKKYKGSEEKVVIPEMIEDLPVKEIATGAFSGCETIKELIIPESVQKIDHMAVTECVNMEAIVILNPYVYIAPVDNGYVYEVGKPPYTPHGVMVKFPAFMNNGGVVYGYRNSTTADYFDLYLPLEDSGRDKAVMMELDRLASIIDADMVSVSEPKIQKDGITLTMTVGETVAKKKKWNSEDEENVTLSEAVTIYNGKYYVPLADVMGVFALQNPYAETEYAQMETLFDKLGISYSVDEEKMLVEANRGDIKLTFKLDDVNVTVNDKSVVWEQCAKQMYSSYYVPKEEILKTFGLSLKFNNSTNNVEVIEK